MLPRKLRPVRPNLTLTKRSSWVGAHTAALWDAWVFAAVESELALNAWKRAAMELKEATFGMYHAALDREEQAAAALASLIAPNAA